MEKQLQPIAVGIVLLANLGALIGEYSSCRSNVDLQLARSLCHKLLGRSLTLFARLVARSFDRLPDRSIARSVAQSFCPALHRSMT